MSTVSTVQELWEQRRWPCVDGIYFSSGDVIMLECALNLWVRPLARTTLDSILEFNVDMMTELTELSPDAGSRVRCGEGSNGAEGFVSLLHADGSIVWVAYFQSSNPFIAARLDADGVVATTNLGHVWTFPLDHPEKVSVLWKTP